VCEILQQPLVLIYHLGILAIFALKNFQSLVLNINFIKLWAQKPLTPDFCNMRLPKYTIPILILSGTLATVLGAGYLLLTAGRGLGQYMFGRGFAEGELREYVASVLRDEVNGCNCQPVDTDDNGYVSCDFSTKSQPQKVRSLECAAWGMRGFLTRGCKSRFPEF
jgi:hypothetical protein